MKFEKLLDMNNAQYRNRIYKRNNQVIYIPKRAVINDIELIQILSFASLMNRNNYRFIDVVFDFSKKRFGDKLSYIILEYICLYLSNTKRNIYVIMSEKDDIYTAGIRYSPLQHLRFINKDEQTDFVNEFYKDMRLRHYRKVISEDSENVVLIPSLVMTDVQDFLKHISISAESSKDISSVVSELVDNAIDHGQKGVLIDLDVTDEYIRVDEADNKYYGVNIVVMNFSDVLLGDLVKNKLKYDELMDSRMNSVRLAYNNHSSYFNYLTYCEEDFYILSSFQHWISGRLELRSTGGTGLTELISSLADRSDAYNCYVISGNRKLRFIRALLNYNSDYWYGFNKDQDFINMPPDDQCFSRNSFFMPGVAYNLNFVLRKEDSDEGN